MSSWKPIAAILLVGMLASSMCLAMLPAGSEKSSQSGSVPTAARPFGSVSPTWLLNSTEYLTPTINKEFTTTVWTASSTPYTGTIDKSTAIDYTGSALPYSGYTLFRPGTGTNGTDGSFPTPSGTSAWGWLGLIQPFAGTNITVLGGLWGFNIGINITAIANTGNLGSVYTGVAAYAESYDAATSTFTFIHLFTGENSSFNLSNGTIGNYSISIDVNAPRIELNASQELFLEYFLNASLFLPSSNFSCDMAIGGQLGETYNFTYPDYGWIAGAVSPSGAAVFIDGGSVVTNASGEFNVTAAAGAYTVTVTLSGYASYSTNISVASAYTRTLSIHLSELFGVDFLETGLQSGTSWEVQLNGTTMSSTGDSVGFQAVNGTYAYSILPVPGYRLVGNYSSPLDVNGSNLTVTVGFVQVTYGVVFNQIGISAGTPWKVFMNNETFTSTSSSIVISLPNGTYAYSVPLVQGFVLHSDASGVITINGTSAAVNLSYSQYTFQIDFEESGLPAGTNWSVTLNGVTRETTAQIITFQMPNGTYSYTVGQISGFSSGNGTSTVRIDGAGKYIPLNFTAAASGRGGNSPVPLLSSTAWLIILIVGALIGIELVAGALYFRRPKNTDSETRTPRGSSVVGRHGQGRKRWTIMHMLGRVSPGRGSPGTDTNLSLAQDVGGTVHAYTAPQTVPVLSGLTREEYAGIVEGGGSYAVFEQTAQSSMELFEACMGLGYGGLCFTRQYPERVKQKLEHDAAVFWLSNIGSENSIRPKDLEKITLQCNERLGNGKSVILIDGMEYLVTNNGFITVLKMLQFLRDATAVSDSILILSINPSAINENEVNLILREVDKVIR